MICLPDYIKDIIERMDDKGHEAYGVGGCVRDLLMGKVPGDYDICTSAKPEEIKGVFAGERTIDTGIAHGTVTLVCPEGPVEITTFRRDGDYGDGRRPDKVDFVGDLKEDLRRRDFTINAMAVDCTGQVIDLFGGQEDLEDGIIRTVGPAEDRFAEDRLRILRCLRFASCLGFDIDAETEAAARTFCSHMAGVSAEIIKIELEKLMKGKSAFTVLTEFGDLLEAVLGQYLGSRPVIHRSLVEGYRPLGTFGDFPMMMAIAFGQEGDAILRALKASKAEAKKCQSYSRIISFIEEGTRQLSLEDARRLISLYGFDTVEALAKGPFDCLKVYADFVRENHLCCTISELDLDGKDLEVLGLSGKEVGQALDFALEEVLEGRVENSKKELVELVAGTFVGR